MGNDRRVDALTCALLRRGVNPNVLHRTLGWFLKPTDKAFVRITAHHRTAPARLHERAQRTIGGDWEQIHTFASVIGLLSNPTVPTCDRKRVAEQATAYLRQTPRIDPYAPTTHRTFHDIGPERVRLQAQKERWDHLAQALDREVHRTPDLLPENDRMWVRQQTFLHALAHTEKS